MKIIKNLIWIFINGLLGIFLIYSLNIILDNFNLSIGINILTIITSAILGIPGVFMLYGLNFFI